VDVLPLALNDPVSLAVLTSVLALLRPVTSPVKLKLDSVPTDVILGCAAVVTVPAVVAAPDTVMVYVPLNRAAGTVPVSKLVALSDVNARPLPVTAPAVIKLLPVTLPVTDSDVPTATKLLACPNVNVLPANALIAPLCSNIISTELMPSPTKRFEPGVPIVTSPPVEDIIKLLAESNSICALVLAVFLNSIIPLAGVINTSFDILV